MENDTDSLKCAQNIEKLLNDGNIQKSISFIQIVFQMKV
jgi:hypothetical protein